MTFGGRRSGRAVNTARLLLSATMVSLSFVAESAAPHGMENPAMAMTLRSKAFENGGTIPQTYTCQGEDVSPPLSWEGIPPGTRSLVLIVDDPDAPDPNAPQMTWVHWVLFNIPPDAGGLEQDAARGNLPPGSETGLNDWNRADYGGPCPPTGRHRYFFRLHALDKVLRFRHSPDRKEVEAAMSGAVIEQTELVGTYRKR